MKRIIPLICGILIGSTLFGGSIAYAAGILAERSTHRVFVDGTEIELEAYTINGHNYVKLRDIGQAVGFNVYWDGSVRIDSTAPYTGEAPIVAAVPEAPRVLDDAHLSDVANPKVFDQVYSSDAYRIFRRTIMDSETALAADSDYLYASAALSETTCSAMREVAAALSCRSTYAVKTGLDGSTQITVRRNGNYQAAADYCASFVSGLDGMDETTKIREIAFFVCDHLTYRSDATASPRTALVSDTVQPGNCMSYARCFKFLCDLAGVPCIYVHSDVHQWNQVYVNGSWFNADISSTDAGDSVSVRDYKVILHTNAEMQNSIYCQTQPALSAFAKELLVPGSTK